MGESSSLVSYKTISHLLLIAASVEYMKKSPELEKAHVLTAEFVPKLDSSLPVSQSQSLAVLSAAPVRTDVESPWIR